MSSAAALLLVLLAELMGQMLAREGLCGADRGLGAGGGSAELYCSAAVLSQPLSTLRALLSRGRQDALPAPSRS